MLPAVADLWARAVIVPADAGTMRTATTPQLARRTTRKLRTLAMAEALTKYAESVIIQQDYSKVVRALQPKQLGCGTPDAQALMVDFVKTFITRRSRRQAGA